MALAFRQIARNLRVANEPTEAIVHRVDDHGGPKTRAVFTDTPALPGKVATCFGLCQYVIRETCGNVLRKEETAEVPTQYFRAGVSLVPLCSAVPSGYQTLGVQH